MAARSHDARYFCGPAPCLVKRDGQNPVRSLTPLGPPSFGGIRDRQRPKRVMNRRDRLSASCPLHPWKRTSLCIELMSVLGQERKCSLTRMMGVDFDR